MNDIGHSNELHCHAYQAMKSALEIRDANMYDDAICYFRNEINEYEKHCDKKILQEPIVYKKYDLGEAEEIAYRVWCLSHHLFLNLLNDLINIETAFAHDPLTITHYMVDKRKEMRDSTEPPKWFSMLNQLKEEYIYSLFDQIAFFINDFWKLGIKGRYANAANVFSHDNYPKENVALQAIFWSYCELNERFGDAENPSEKKWKVLRNALEHKFAKFHEYSYKAPLKTAEDGFYHISEDDLKKGVIRLLELGREWLIYLVYAIEIEERKSTNSDNVFCLTIQDFGDEWKV